MTYCVAARLDSGLVGGVDVVEAPDRIEILRLALVCHVEGGAEVEAGVVGLVLLIVGLTHALVRGLRLPRTLRGPPVAALLGSLVGSFFLSNFEYKFFWAVLTYVAITSLTLESARSDRATGLPTTGRTPVPAGQDVR